MEFLAARLGTCETVRSPTSSIQSAATDPAAFDRILSDPEFAEIEAYPHTGAFGRTYHPAIHGNHDLSFAVGANDVAVLICLCAPLDGKLGFYGMPLRLIGRRGLDGDTHRAAVQSTSCILTNSRKRMTSTTFGSWMRGPEEIPRSKRLAAFVAQQ